MRALTRVKGTSTDYRAIQGVTGTLGAYSDALYAFTSREFGGKIGVDINLVCSSI